MEPTENIDEPLTNEEAAIGFLNQAHALITGTINSDPSFSNAGLYPFELTNMSLLMSIAHGLRSLNEKLDDYMETLTILNDKETMEAIREAELGAPNQLFEPDSSTK